ncbi:MAG: 3-keto-5-aminohexanoate cleavage protein [Woeseiaceae bacterium]|nr:3-keto-5-aminohexanoate cleavage protein [Woeseiaceae bacterium]MDG1865358.1 3-keto-5-aminohexanoate cleavage protein [Woeseiaceae bacterium]
MPLNTTKEVFITCAVTGSGASHNKSDLVPRSPKEIAESAVDAAKAGAAIVHCHVRDPDTGEPARSPALYKEVTERIRDSKTDVIINLTAGMGGDVVFGPIEAPLPLLPTTDMVGASERMQHVIECRPEICTLDCGTMNFADDVMANTPSILRSMAKIANDCDVRIEIEAFDTGHLWFAKQLVKEGIIPDPVLIQLCMGIPWGAPDDLNTFMAMVNNIPNDWVFSAFSIGKNQMPYVAAATLAGGNVRVGLEDNIYLEKGLLATNAELVEKASSIITNLGSTIIGPDEVRKKLNLKKCS